MNKTTLILVAAVIVGSLVGVALKGYRDANTPAVEAA